MINTSSFLLVFTLVPTLAAQSLFDGEPQDRRPRTYDVIHYKLDLRFDEKNKRVHGKTDITLRPLDAALDSLTLDAADLNVSSVTLGATPLRFRSTSNDLSIFFDSRHSPSDTITVSIDYSCKPEKGLYFIQPDSGDLTRRSQIWTQGEEMDNRYWFPCYDFPDDKATSEVIATVQENYAVLSNGALVSESHDTTAHTRTFHWKQSNPHTSYLIMLAAGEYTILRETYRDFPLLYYVYPEQADDAPRSFRKTPAIMEFLEQTIGFPYPWEKFAQIIIDEFMWGGMENTSAVTLNEIFIYDTRASIDYSAHDVVAHELAHQWWGDLVTCKDWTHLWLNEGFANYYEALFKRHDLGESESQYEAYISSQGVRKAEESQGRKPIVSQESHGINLYQKGAWVLRMLNDILGEERFNEAIRYYIRKHAFTSAMTQDFALAVEESAGEELDWFFDQWVYKAGHPILEVTQKWDEQDHRLKITITQTQTTDSLTGLFRFPLDIEWSTPSGGNRSRVWVSKEEEMFVFPMDEGPDMVIVDKGLNALKTLRHSKTKSEWVDQLENATDVTDRLDALENLESFNEDHSVFHAVKWTAFNDPFWAARARATRILGEMEIERVKELLFELYGDRDSRVRDAAIGSLAQFKVPDVAAFIESAAMNDSSYVVFSTAVRTMVSVDSSRAFGLAAKFLDTESYRDVIRRACLGVFRSLRDERAIPYVAKLSGPNYETSTRTAALGVLKEIGKNDRDGRKLMEDFAADPNAAIRRAAVRALAQWDLAEFRNLLEARQKVEQDKDVLRIIEEVLGLKDHSNGSN